MSEYRRSYRKIQDRLAKRSLSTVLLNGWAKMHDGLCPLAVADFARKARRGQIVISACLVIVALTMATVTVLSQDAYLLPLVLLGGLVCLSGIFALKHYERIIVDFDRFLEKHDTVLAKLAARSADLEPFFKVEAERLLRANCSLIVAYLQKGDNEKACQANWEADENYELLSEFGLVPPGGTHQFFPDPETPLVKVV